jgi:predicted nucleic acid-binding protein
MSASPSGIQEPSGATSASCAIVLHVVVDTNVLTGDKPFMASAYLRALEATRAGQIRLVVPDIVLRETANRWAHSVAENDQAMTRAHRKLLRAGAEVGDLPDAVNIGRLHRLLIEESTAEIEGAGGLVPSLPQVGHEAIVSRALDRLQPFDSKGRNGYRDVLLWENVLELLRAGRQVLLVSNDRAAFSAGGKAEGVLAAHLSDEARAAAGRDGAIVLAHDLTATIATFASPDAEALAQFERLAEDEAFLENLDHRLDNELYDYTLDRRSLETLGLPPGLLGGRILQPEWWWPEEGVEDLEILDARKTGDEVLLIELRLTRPEDVELRFAADTAQSVLSVTDLGSPELDDDQGLLRGTKQVRCMTRADVRLRTNGEILDIAVTAVDVVSE